MSEPRTTTKSRLARHNACIVRGDGRIEWEELDSRQEHYERRLNQIALEDGVVKVELWVGDQKATTVKAQAVTRWKVHLPGLLRE